MYYLAASLILLARLPARYGLVQPRREERALFSAIIVARVPLPVRQTHQPPARRLQLPPLEERLALWLLRAADEGVRPLDLDADGDAARLQHQVELIALRRDDLGLITHAQLRHGFAHLGMGVGVGVGVGVEMEMEAGMEVEMEAEVEVEVEVEVVAVDHLTAVTCFFLLRLVSSITTDLESWLGLGLG